MIRKILLFLLVVLVIIQFFHPAKNISAGDQPNALTKAYPIPESVDTILRKACYDCHSNNTVYPWYSRVQPSAWFLANHIKNGKRHFNFDEFMTYPKDRQDHKLEEFEEMIEHDEMPLSTYKWMHTDARLTEQEKNVLLTWVKQLRAQVKG